jgi:hypothetical protein
VVAGFAAGLERASLFVLKEIDEFGNGGLFNSEPFETGMARVKSPEPR